MEKTEGRARIIRAVLTVVLSYTGLVGVRNLYRIINMGNGYAGAGYLGFNIYQIFLFATDVWLIYRFLKFEDRRRTLASLLMGALLSVSCVAGASLLYKADLFYGTAEDIRTILNMVELGFVTIPVSEILFEGLDFLDERISRAKAADCLFKRADSFFEKKPVAELLIVWVITFLSFVPIFLANWPLNFIADASYQMSNYVDGHITTHHPVLHTLIMGWTYDLGLKMGSPSLGFQFYSLFQMIVLSFAAAYCIYFLRKVKSSAFIRIFAILFFLIMPYYKLAAISTIKDGMAGAFILIYIVGTALVLTSQVSLKWTSYIIPVIGGIFACLFRNNMIYAIVAAGILAVIVIKDRKEKLLIGMLALTVAVGSLVSGKAINKAADAVEIDKYRETLSVPLQCLARAMVYSKDDIPADLVEDFSHYVTDEHLAGYSAFIADPIKNDANEDLLKNNTFNFVKLWLKVGFRCPTDYFEAVGSLVQGYFYPLETSYGVVSDVDLYTMPYEKIEPIERKNLAPWHKIFDCFYNNDRYSIPLWGILFRPVLYVWGLLFIAAWEIVKKKRKAFVITLMPLMYFGTCILGPTASMRYILPVIFSIPILIWAGFDKNLLTDGGEE